MDNCCRRLCANRRNSNEAVRMTTLPFMAHENDRSFAPTVATVTDGPMASPSEARVALRSGEEFSRPQVMNSFDGPFTYYPNGGRVSFVPQPQVNPSSLAMAYVPCSRLQTACRDNTDREIAPAAVPKERVIGEKAIPRKKSQITLFQGHSLLGSISAPQKLGQPETHIVTHTKTVAPPSNTRETIDIRNQPSTSDTDTLNFEYRDSVVAASEEVTMHDTANVVQGTAPDPFTKSSSLRTANFISSDNATTGVEESSIDETMQHAAEYSNILLQQSREGAEQLDHLRGMLRRVEVRCRQHLENRNKVAMWFTAAAETCRTVMDSRRQCRAATATRNALAKQLENRLKALHGEELDSLSDAELQQLAHDLELGLEKIHIARALQGLQLDARQDTALRTDWFSKVLPNPNEFDLPSMTTVPWHEIEAINVDSLQSNLQSLMSAVEKANGASDKLQCLAQETQQRLGESARRYGEEHEKLERIEEAIQVREVSGGKLMGNISKATQNKEGRSFESKHNESVQDSSVAEPEKRSRGVGTSAPDAWGLVAAQKRYSAL